ncbi:MAG: class I SAM-dependent methyltransferase [Candidatus Micrarchaeota archaeon]
MDAYNEIASSWEESRQRPFAPIAFFLGDLMASERVLDAGCGNGRNLVEIAARCGEAYGIDSSHEMLKFAESRLIAKKMHNAAVLCGNIISLPFGDGFFDRACCTAVLHHLPEDGHLSALRELWRTLKPGATLFITVWAENKSGEREGHVRWKPKAGKIVHRYYYFFGKDELVSKLRGAGFAIRDLFYERDGQRTDAKKARNICVFALRPPK